MSKPRTTYALATAFTSSPFGGNPAAIIFADTSLSAEYFGKIAKNFNQPMLSVVSNDPLPSDDEGVLVHAIRFFAPNGKEVPLCGHGTLAACKVLFASSDVQARGDVHTAHFKTTTGAIMKAVQFSDGFIEISLPAANIQAATADEKVRLAGLLDKAFGRHVLVNDVQIGTGSYEPYVLVELDVNEDLAGSVIDAKQLLGNGFMVNVLTTKSPNQDAVFVSRMFSPLMLNDPGEDHVCGSAHGLLVPHWFSKLGIASGDTVKAKQVSERGGDLMVVWEKEKSRIRLRGQSVILASGELHI